MVLSWADLRSKGFSKGFRVRVRVRVRVKTRSSQCLGGSKSINHTSMHRVEHEEMNESSAHGVPLPSRDCLSQS